MIYRNDYSLLGFGCMRLPGKFDEAEKIIMEGIGQGINYFDTAYIYPGNETLLGKILSKNGCRDNVKIATKLPPYLINKKEDIDKMFETQLARLQTDYIDSYLIHMLPDVKTWERLKELDIEEWITKKKESGQIKKIGFSFHGSSTLFTEVLESYPWDFCQIQYNYMDENSQAGRMGLEAAYEKGIDVIIMEPLRGGNLINGLCKDAIKIIEGSRFTPAGLGLSWLYNQKEITCVLSGMNSVNMVIENADLLSKEISLNQEDFDMIEKVKEAINRSVKIGCTACSYCMPCPVGVDIPGSFRCYNVSYTDGYMKGFHEYMLCTTLRATPSNASLCVKCGKCENHCPQHLPIRNNLKLVKRRFEHPIYKVARIVTNRMFKKKNKC